MQIGLGLYREMLIPDNFRFAVQAGAPHVVDHLTAAASPACFTGGASPTT